MYISVSSNNFICYTLPQNATHARSLKLVTRLHSLVFPRNVQTPTNCNTLLPRCNKTATTYMHVIGYSRNNLKPTQQNATTLQQHCNKTESKDEFTAQTKAKAAEEEKTHIKTRIGAKVGMSNILVYLYTHI